MIRKVRQRIARLFTRPSTVYLVSDGAEWAFDWVARYVASGLNDLEIDAHITTSPWKLHNQIIHFGDRYQYLQGNGPQQLHPSNYVFLTWFHGDPANPAFAELGVQLRNNISRLQMVVTSCRTSYKQLVAFGIPPNKIVIIPIGVDTKIFSAPTPLQRTAMRNLLGISQDAFCIGSFQKDGTGWNGGDEPKLIKGPDIFLQVIAKLNEQYSNLHILLTGPARNYVMKGLEQIGVPYTHQFLDNFHAIADYYHALDLYLITSRAEGGPKALMESWASGIPVVSTRMGMPADYVVHGKNGLLAQVDDVDGLVRCASDLVEQPERRNQIISQGLQDVQQLDWLLVAEQYYHKLYQPILGN
jgi:glycosyltransferase involved in cell wall biosynthesis